MLRATRVGLCLAPFMLAAYGSGDEAVLVEACVKEGGGKAYCECRSEAVSESISDEDRKLLVKMTRLQLDQNISAEQVQEQLFKEEGPARLMTFQFGLMGPLMKAEEKCR
jgi:hypothetical protein